jgi:hypothetical protein
MEIQNITNFSKLLAEINEGRIPLTQQSQNQTSVRLSDNTYTGLSTISGFQHKVDEICALLGYYTVYSGNSLRMLRDNLQSHLQWSSKSRLGFLDT